MTGEQPPISAGCEDALTRLLAAARDGDGDGEGRAAAAAAELFRLVYAELRSLARRRMAEERAGHTLQATALVHEAYLKLMGAEGAAPWSDRRQFFFAAAEAMRQILIDHARARSGLKRGGGRKRVPLSVVDLAADDQIPEILALDDAVSRLEQESPDVAAVVRLRFYAGLNVEETAEALGVSPRTVKREWTYARARLFRELAPEGR
jgi:RNA polymerase sigma factor (TIGR02999 family)